MNHRILFEFEEHMRNNKKYSENTIQSYMADIKNFLIFMKNEGLVLDSIHKVNKTFVLSYVLNMQQNGKTSKTVVRAISSLKVFMSYLSKKGITVASIPLRTLFLVVLA